jgi:hypothetical protein
MSTVIDYRDLFNPSAAKPGRTSFVLAHLAGRTFWHKLYDNTPLLAQALGESGSVDALLAFLADCDRQQKSLDWRMPLIFLEWLRERHPQYVQDDGVHVLECLSAAAAAWAGEIVDVGMVRMILVCNRSRHAVGVMRTSNIDSGSRVFRLQLDSLSPLAAHFQYALSARADTWSTDTWHPVAV